ncbi:MAG: hypothetical protein WCC21_12070 [Candidatus Acidiferrales bacterium]
MAPGSSLGGARPKASVIEKDGHLAIVKFPRKDDEKETTKANKMIEAMHQLQALGKLEA